MARWKKIVLVIVGSLAAVITIAVVAGLWLTSGLVDKVEAHLDAIKAGNLRGAYEQTAAQFQQDTAFEQYEAFLQNYPSLAQLSEYDIGARQFKNNTGTVEVTVEDAAGAALPLTFTLVKENGEWRVFRIDIAERAGITD
jgi:ABC-type transporter MlaC component